MDINQNTGIARGVSTRELDCRGYGRTASSDRQLDARQIELSTAEAARGVQSQGLGPEEVVASFDVGGDLDVEAAAAGVDVLSAPVVVVAGRAGGVLGPGVGVDLEPPVGAVCGGGVVYGAKVGLYGSVVGTADGLGGACTISRLLDIVSL